MALDRRSSGEIVKELVRVLGEKTTLEMLAVDPSRFKFLCSGRGCLSDVQLDCISHQTKQSWMRWGVDAGARYAKSAKDRSFVASAYAMWDQIEGKSKPSKVAKPRMSQSARFTPAASV